MEVEVVVIGDGGGKVGKGMWVEEVKGFVGS